MPSRAEALDRLQATLGHRFRDPSLLDEALVHRSYASEQNLDFNYERLEFLGDAVLQLAVTHYLYEEFPDLAEGEMAKVRAGVVNERTLAAAAEELGLPALVRLGRGEELTGGREKTSILSDVVESLLGAAYLDAGFDAVRSIVIERWSALIDDRATDPGRRDYKTRLQESLAKDRQRPAYDVEESGPEHAKRFFATVSVDGEVLGTGSGTSKKRAEQAAAMSATKHLETGAGPAEDA